LGREEKAKFAPSANTHHPVPGVFKIRPVLTMAKLNNAVNSSSVYIMLDV
jgi:hypothetical protein